MRFCNNVIIALMLFFVSNLQAQEQLGMKLENYSGINSVMLNPTYHLTSPLRWNLNIASVGVFTENTYGYVRDASIISLLKSGDNLHSVTDFDDESMITDDMVIADFYDDDSKKMLSSLVTVMGPSFMLQLEGGYSVGVFSNFRASVSTLDIPGNLNYYFFNKTSFNQEFEIDPFKVAGMSWSEIGVNFSRKLDTYYGSFAAGINVKYLSGYEAFYLRSNETARLTQLPGDSLLVNDLDLEYGFTKSSINGFDGMEKNGGGWGIDVGISYIDEGEYVNYWYKFGVALLDIGRIKFKNNAENHHLKMENQFIFSPSTYKNLDDVEQLVNRFSLEALNDSLASFQDDNFSIWLPGAISLYGDYSIDDNIYINTTLIQRIPFKGNAINRDNIFAVTPRYEHRWFSVMLPVSLYNYKKFRYGFSARLAFLTIGTENLGSFFNNKELKGTDFYVGLKFNPWDVGWSFGKGGGGARCYDF